MKNAELAICLEKMESLGLSFMAANLESFLYETGRSDKTLLTSVLDLIELEYIPRMERMGRTRLKVSGIPEKKRLEDFNLDWLKGGLTRATYDGLTALTFIDRKENVILLGPSGTGKTHLLLALGYKACISGFTAYYASCGELLEELQKARKAGRLKKKLSWLSRPHVLLLDEVGYETLAPEEATLFFQLVNARYEKGSIVMTSNKTFGQWGEVMNDNAKATATLDRLLHHAQVYSLKGDSYRMKERQKMGADMT
jgi:DNA replication protein DnaC